MNIQNKRDGCSIDALIQFFFVSIIIIFFHECKYLQRQQNKFLTDFNMECLFFVGEIAYEFNVYDVSVDNYH